MGFRNGFGGERLRRRKEESASAKEESASAREEASGRAD